MNRYGAHWRKVRPLILYRDGYRCAYCGGYATTVDHVKALAEGGAMYDPANLVAACAPCNYRRGALVGAARSKWRTPAKPGPRQVWSGAIRL